MERVQEVGGHGGRWEWQLGPLRAASGGWAPLARSCAERARARLVEVSGARRPVRGSPSDGGHDGAGPHVRVHRGAGRTTVDALAPLRKAVGMPPRDYEKKYDLNHRRDDRYMYAKWGVTEDYFIGSLFVCAPPSFLPVDCSDYCARRSCDDARSG
jgi:hypothetical protein